VLDVLVGKRWSATRPVGLSESREDLGLGETRPGYRFLDVPERQRQARAAQDERRHQDERAEARQRAVIAQQEARRAAYLRVIHHELGHNEMQRARGLMAVRETPPAAANPLFETFRRRSWGSTGKRNRVY
jgi:hypothetical protein